MTERQEHLLQLLGEFVQICKENDLKYVVAEKTALGTMQREGFLPGDDTVTVYMPTDDWHRLLDIAETVLAENRTLLCLEKDSSFGCVSAGYASTDSCALRRHQMIGSGCAGERIEVFLLDPVSEDEGEYEKYCSNLMLYADLADPDRIYGDRWENSAASYERGLLSCRTAGKDRVLKKMEQALQAHEAEQCSCYAVRSGESPSLFEKTLLFPAKEKSFQGIQVMVPGRICDYLTECYGDEWSHFSSCEKAGLQEIVSVEGLQDQELRKDYMPGIRKGKLFRACIKRKKQALSGARKEHRLRQNNYQILVSDTKIALESQIQKCGQSIKALLEQRDFQKLNQIFSGYYQVQLSEESIGSRSFEGAYTFCHPVLIDIGAENFYAAVLTLVYTERIGKARRMLEIRQKTGVLSPEAVQLKADLEAFQKAVSAYEERHFQEAEDWLEPLLERYPKIPGFVKLKSRFLMERARNGIEQVEAELYIDEALRIFPEDGYFLKYKGELQWMLGKCADALGIFADAREHTDNKVVHYELDQFLTPYSRDTIKTCQMLLDVGQKEGAMSLIELWRRLLPENQQIQECYELARVSTAKTYIEMERITEEILQDIRKGSVGATGEEKGREPYRAALTKAWERLGYPKELAQLRTELVFTREAGDMEWLAEKAKDCQNRKEKRAQVYKLIGDIRMKQGQTDAAFENYKKAMSYGGKGYVNIELYRIFLTDLLEGGKRAAAYARVTDASEYLDRWLGRYKSTEELQQLVKALAENGSFIKCSRADRKKTPEPSLQTGTQDEHSHSKESYPDRCWNYVKFCAAKITLEKYYLENKDYIINLYKNKDYPALEKIFARYTDATVKSMETDEIFVPDEELQHIYLDVLEKTGCSKLKKKVEKYWK